jgi:2-polyprenyl-3-methyl-5-hydroxy-6-metoxy-1,4-benzoquinol methylase
MNPPKSIESDEDLVALYNIIYGTKTPLRPYGTQGNRNRRFLQYIEQNLKPGARILDASCGKGHLAARLVKRNYEVELSEITPRVVRYLRKRFPAAITHQLTYAQLSTLPSKSFDAICSNDVLEHLLDEDAALAAIEEFARLSRGHVLISVGLGAIVNKYLLASGITHIKSLHRVVRPPEWWKEVMGKYVEVNEEHFFYGPRTVFIFGRVK